MKKKIILSILVICLFVIFMCVIFTIKKRSERSNDFFISFFNDNEENLNAVVTLCEADFSAQMRYSNKGILYEPNDSNIQDRIEANEQAFEGMTNLFESGEISSISLDNSNLEIHLKNISKDYRGQYVYSKDDTFDHTFGVIKLKNKWFLEILPNV